MFNLLLGIVATMGLTSIVVEGKIASNFRQWVRENKPIIRIPKFITKIFKLNDISISDIISCQQCCGFWCGLVCGTLVLIPPNYLLYLNYVVLFGFGGSWCSQMSGVILDYYTALLYGIEETPEEEETDEQS